MRFLTFNECDIVSGGTDARVLATGIAALVGGIATTQIASFFSPLCTFGGALTGATGGAILGLPFLPPVGSVVCGVTGGGLGYLLGSTFCQLGSFISGTAAAGLAAHLYLPH